MDKQIKVLTDAIMLAGKIMIENGADMTRVDDTLYRIAKNGGIKDPKIFETITGIMISVADNNIAQVEPIQNHGIDLEKVSRVNDVSREFQDKKLTIEQMYVKLKEIDQKVPVFAWHWQLLAAFIISSPLLMMYGGKWQDFLSAGIISVIGYSVYYEIKMNFKIRFVNEFLSSFTIGLLAVLAVKYHLGTQLDMLIIAAVMPLVPGVAIMNSVRDILAGHLLSGIARGAESLLTACAIGFGIALVLKFM